ncbi:MAG: hypothetical protein JO148_07390 [Acidimicrobiia bacterium]|nr:hypothetical protein [Acidimicrobiia bacterium]
MTEQGTPGELPLSTGPSALPSRGARALAFAAIILAGVCGGLIGYAVVKTSCHGMCGTPEGVGSVTGAVIAAGGVAIVAVLVLRAMGEWKRIQQEREDQLRQEHSGDAPDL